MRDLEDILNNAEKPALVKNPFLVMHG